MWGAGCEGKGEKTDNLEPRGEKTRGRAKEKFVDDPDLPEQGREEDSSKEFERKTPQGWIFSYTPRRRKVAKAHRKGTRCLPKRVHCRKACREKRTRGQARTEHFWGPEGRTPGESNACLEKRRRNTERCRGIKRRANRGSGRSTRPKKGHGEEVDSDAKKIR